MNAAIRAVTRAGIAAGLKVKGIYRGYEGLINNEIQDFTTENVRYLYILLMMVRWQSWQIMSR